MQTIPSQATLEATTNAAERRAEANYRANLGAIRSLQPRLIRHLDDRSCDVEWLFGRDGSLTAMESGDRWSGGCSLPLSAAKFMLKTMSIHDPVACFLHPIHAAQVRVALDMLEPSQAVVALVPEPRTLRVMLHCDDFSTEIGSHRLWFITGPGWETDLAQLFADHRGLPTPAQFIRPILAESEPADALIGPAQEVFAQIGAERAKQIQDLIVEWKPDHSRTKNLCVIAPSRFRLWNDAPNSLWNVLGEPVGESGAPQVQRFDSDSPTSASPLALAEQIVSCDAVCAADLTRADVPGVAPREMPWITWITRPHIIAAQAAGPRDRLIVADPAWQALAQQAGWPGERVQVGSWPSRPVACHHDQAFVSVIVDTSSLEVPDRVREYSSHGLLWELIQSELLSDPFLIGESADSYLDERMKRMQIAASGFDRSLLIERLIVPAYQQGLARLLISENVPVRLFGKGWDHAELFSPHHGGPVKSREQLQQILSASKVVLHVWPSDDAHPIDAAGRPVLRAFDQRREAFLHEIRAALRRESSRTKSPLSEVLSRQLVLSLL